MTTIQATNKAMEVVPPPADEPVSVTVPSPDPVTGSGGPSADAAPSNATETPAQRAERKRAASPIFVRIWSLDALRPSLPLRFAVDPKLPPSPKRHYRSAYRNLGLEPVFDPTQRAVLSDFQIVMYLVDFSGLERELAQGYLTTLKGQVPFDPVSMFLAVSLRLELRLSWRKLGRLLAGPDGAYWRLLCGFAEGQTPSTSGLRYFFHHVMGREVFDNLCQRLVTLLRLHGLIPTQSTYPDDPPGRGIAITQDGQLHPARHCDCCQLATDECFRPLVQSPSPTTSAAPESGEAPTTGVNTSEGAQTSTTPEPPPTPALATPAQPAPEPGAEPGSSPLVPANPGSKAKADSPEKRPCRARRLGHGGCRCDTPACAERCQRASQLDPDARYQHYSGHNDKHGKGGKHSKGGRGQRAKPSGKDGGEGGKNAAGATDDKPAGGTRGTDCHGYRDVVDCQVVDRDCVAWPLQTGVYPSNTDERTIFTSRLAGLKAKYPDQKIGEWIDDSGVGYDECLRAIHELEALRMVDIRGAPEDDDPATCLRRGYDGQGRPLCPFGYLLRSNGYDYGAQRAKYVCAGVCRRQPLREGEPVSPVKDCPYLPELGDSRSLGQVVNVGLTMPDGSTRLARDIPYGSEKWNARYGRRNNSESRNGQLAGMGLKRMISHGLDRVTRDLQMADFIRALRTVGRLTREARAVQDRQQKA